MATPNMKAALEASLRGEAETVADRFAKAETFFNHPPSPTDSEPSARQAPPREKVIRDGFTMPAGDYQLIAEIRERCLEAGISLTKSEVLRAGLHALTGMQPEDLQRITSSLTKVKPGRPSAS